MSGSPISVFNDLNNQTGVAILRGPEDLRNLTTKHSYILRYALAGKEAHEYLQGGSKIQNTVFVTQSGTFRRYQINPQHSYKLHNNTVNYEGDWRFGTAYKSWTEEEIDLNTGDLSAAARHHQYKRLMKTKNMAVATDCVTALDDEMLADPISADMEASSGQVPYSMHALVNEFANGLAPGFSTLQGIDPVAYPGWTNEQATYDTVGLDDGTTTDHLFLAFSKATHDMHYDRMPKFPDLSDQLVSPTTWLASLRGVMLYEQALRVNQDEFAMTGKQDPDFNHPTFRGIPVMRIEGMDYSNAYAGAAGLAGEYAGITKPDGTPVGTPDNAGPRFMGVDWKCVASIFHEAKYFNVKKAFFLQESPTTWIQPVYIYNQLMATDRRGLGIISPGSAIANPIP